MNILKIAFTIFGIILFYLIASLENIESFKLLNIAGLVLDIVGLTLLSEYVFLQQEIAEKYAGKIERSIVIVFISISAGAILGGALFYWLSLPSTAIALKFLVGLTWYIGGPLFLASYLTNGLQLLQNPTKRAYSLGFVMLVSGLLVQLVASFQDY